MNEKTEWFVITLKSYEINFIDSLIGMQKKTELQLIKLFGAIDLIRNIYSMERFGMFSSVLFCRFKWWYLFFPIQYAALVLRRRKLIKIENKGSTDQKYIQSPSSQYQPFVIGALELYYIKSNLPRSICQTPKCDKIKFHIKFSVCNQDRVFFVITAY